MAHGTADDAGRATTERLVAAIAAARPAVPVEHCFLDVVEPRLPDALDDRPTVVVPLLLSTGYHVQTDIPAAVAAYPRTVVSRHLGPDDLLVDVLLARLGAVPADGAVALVGAGSSRSAATAELAETGARLARRVGRPVAVHTMADDLVAAFAALPRPLTVATYLLAEGRFASTLRAAADAGTTVAEPLGVHDALVTLAWRRYDETRAAR
ncbi:sirohydrochlorin chelatase [Jatrophihabitans endophyticus]|uniref:sirohydrochlorin chelatase n=1 Tax=Jatrophihabitans endophyticus TaxID=1206085 RepID=UPI0013564F49|nr:CbiX/SirB N-terminal domain-containing protein [Jatrophihabitans endophyticus]